MANQMLEQSLETLLDREDKAANEGELGLTPVRVVPLTPGRIHAEVKAPTPPRLVHTPEGCWDLSVSSSAFRL